MLRRLGPVVGVAAVHTDSLVQRFAAHDHAPRAVVTPRSAPEIAQLLQLCASEKWQVDVAGGATALDAHRTPQPADIALSTDSLRGVHEYEPADLVIGVGAGTPLAELQAAIARYNQELPLDPPDDGRVTVGGMIASGTAGPLAAAYGSPRDYVLGLEVVTGDGRVLNFGGRVVKNVAGYDIVRLITGSHGSLAVITRAFLRLRGRPAADVTIAYTDRRPERLLERFQALQLPTAPAAVELLSPALASEVIGEDQWLLLVRLRGATPAIERALDRMTPMGAGSEVGQEVWATLARAEARAIPHVRLTGRPAAARQLVGYAQALCVRPKSRSGNEMEQAVGWAVAYGVVRGTARVWPTATVDQASLAANVRAVRAEVGRVHGAVRIVRAGPKLAAYTRDGEDADAGAVRIARELKNLFDPSAVLGPGRFPGT